MNYIIIIYPMPNLLFLLLLMFYQTSDYRIDLGKNYDKQKQEKAQGYVETFTIKDEAGKEFGGG